jgi:putative flippase GtrA
VEAIHLAEKGRGRALRAAWTASDSPVVAYMDVDLSTDLDALLPLVAPLVSGHSDLAIGSRLATSSRVVRGPKREAISRTYNLLLKATLRSGFSDAQCGFKAVRGDVAHALLPLIEDEGWFFDTELLVLAEHNGLRIHEVPVDWVDDPDSRVQVVTTARDDLKGIWRMVGRFAHGEGLADLSSVAAPRQPSDEPDLPSQLVRFASVGLVSTGLFALLFLALTGPLGPVLATVAALATCTVANTAAHRRITFSLRGRTGRARSHAASLLVAALPLGLALAALGALATGGVTSTTAQLAVLTVTNAVASLVRFGLLRRWVFRPDVGIAGSPAPRMGAPSPTVRPLGTTGHRGTPRPPR